MSIPVACRCGQQFTAKQELAGQTVKCPSCGQPLRIPTTNPQQQEMQMGGIPNQPGWQSQFGQHQASKKSATWKVPLFIGIGVAAAGLVLTIALLVSSAVSNSGRGEAEQTQPVYNSPQEAANAHFKAVMDEDVEAYYWSLTPASRREKVALTLYDLVDMHELKSYEARQRAELGVVYEGVPELTSMFGINLSRFESKSSREQLEFAYEIAGKLDDPVGFLQECQRRGCTVAKRDTQYWIGVPVLEDLKITGNTATATESFNSGKAKVGPKRYEKVDGTWLKDNAGTYQLMLKLREKESKIPKN